MSLESSSPPLLCTLFVTHVYPGVVPSELTSRIQRRYTHPRVRIPPTPHPAGPRPCLISSHKAYGSLRSAFSVASLPPPPILTVCFCLEIRSKKNNSWLPGHGGGCPAVWLHRGHCQLLLGGEPDPARGWTPVPHDRYTAHHRFPLGGPAFGVVVARFVLFSRVGREQAEEAHPALLGNTEFKGNSVQRALPVFPR